MPPDSVFLWHFSRTREFSSRRQLETSSPRQLIGKAGQVEVWGCGVPHFGIIRPTALLPEVRVPFCRYAAALAAVFRSFLKYRAVFLSTWTNAVAPQRGAILK